MHVDKDRANIGNKKLAGKHLIQRRQVRLTEDTAQNYSAHRKVVKYALITYIKHNFVVCHSGDEVESLELCFTLLGSCKNSFE